MRTNLIIILSAAVIFSGEASQALDFLSKNSSTSEGVFQRGYSYLDCEEAQFGTRYKTKLSAQRLDTLWDRSGRSDGASVYSALPAGATVVKRGAGRLGWHYALPSARDQNVSAQNRCK